MVKDSTRDTHASVLPNLSSMSSTSVSLTKEKTHSVSLIWVRFSINLSLCLSLAPLRKDLPLSQCLPGEIVLHPTTPMAAALAMAKDRNTSPTAAHPIVVTTAAITLALMAAHTSRDHHTVLPIATATATPGTTAIRDLPTRALNQDNLSDKLLATHLLTAEVATRALNSPPTMADSRDTGEQH